MAIRLLIVEDHAVIRSGLRALFETTGDIETVGEATDGAQALAEVRRTRPDVVLMDLGLPRMPGVEAIRRIAEGPEPRPRVLVLTMSDDDASLAGAVRAGAYGYLLKDAGADEVIDGIRSVARGEAVFGAGVAPAVLGLLRGRAAGPPLPFPLLTGREREILDLVARGLGNQAVSARTGVSPKTVANTVSTILAKLGVADRGAAIAAARREGLGG
jgi:DNA-binding NarL/FixJ family response regulator